MSAFSNVFEAHTTFGDWAYRCDLQRCYKLLSERNLNCLRVVCVVNIVESPSDHVNSAQYCETLCRPERANAERCSRCSCYPNRNLDRTVICLVEPLEAMGHISYW